MNEYELQIDTGNAYTLAIPNSKGDDGITPTVTVTDITGGHHVAFSYGSGDPRNTSFDVMDGSDGSDGTNGQDGITPTVVVTNITGGHNVAFNYGTGDSRNTNFDVLNGDPGQGIAPGGTAGQVLKKKSATDYDTEWKDADGGSLLVTFTLESLLTNTVTANYTVKQIVDASESGRAVYGYYNNSVYYLAYSNQYNIYFYQISQVGTSTISQYRIQMTGEDSTTGTYTTTIFSIPTEVVNITWEYRSGGYKSSMTIEQLNTAANAGKLIITRRNNHLYFLADINGSGTRSAEFRTMPELDSGAISYSFMSFLVHDSSGSWWLEGTRTLTASGGGVFEVNITGSGSKTRTSDKTPTEIKAAYDAGMTVVAYIANENKMAYPFTIGSVQVTFCSLPQRGLSNEYDSMMYYSFTITGQDSTSVSVGQLSVTSAESLVGTMFPSAQFWFDWNEQGYQPVGYTQYDSFQWSDFYSWSSQMNHVGVLNFTKIDAQGNWTGTETYISRDVWQDEEYYEPWGDIFTVGNIIFVKTEIDGSTLKTTEIHVKHLFNEGEIFIESRKVATNSVTVTTDYPQPYWPE